MTDSERRLHAMLDRAMAVIDRWRMLYNSKNTPMTSDLIALLDRERREVERLKGVVGRLQQHLGQLSEQLYAAQNESQGEGITRLRKEKDELLRRIEHDATVIKRLSDEKDYLEQAVEMLQRDDRHITASEVRELRVALDAEIERRRECEQARDEASKRAERLREFVNVTKAGLRRQAREIIQLRMAADGPPVLVAPDCGCEVGVNYCPKCDGKYTVYANPVEALKQNPRLKAMLDEDRHRNFNRNVDIQKSHEAPNCPSS